MKLVRQLHWLRKALFTSAHVKGIRVSAYENVGPEVMLLSNSNNNTLGLNTDIFPASFIFHFHRVEKHLYLELEKILKDKMKTNRKGRVGGNAKVLSPNIMQFFPFSSSSMFEYSNYFVQYLNTSINTKTQTKSQSLLKHFNFIYSIH